MYAITRRLDVLAPVLVDCDYSGGRNRRERERGSCYGNGPNCGFGRRISAVEYGPADVTVSLIAPFAELVTATRAYSESEADFLL